MGVPGRNAVLFPIGCPGRQKPHRAFKADRQEFRCIFKSVIRRRPPWPARKGCPVAGGGLSFSISAHIPSKGVFRGSGPRPPLTNSGGKFPRGRKELQAQEINGKSHVMIELTAKELSARGGRAGRGDCKRRTAQMLAYWRKVRAGELPKPKPRGKAKPKQKVLEL